MSAETLAWAIRCKIPRAAVKNMLMVVADLANHVTGEVFASLGYYQDVTGLSKRTVLATLDELVDLNILERTEERRGKTLQIPVYIFHMLETIPMVERPARKGIGAKTHPLPKQVQKGSETGAFLSGKGVQKRTTEPSSRNQEEEESPPPSYEGDTPTGETDLFGGELPVDEDPMPLEGFVTEAWHALKRDHPGVADIDILNPSRIKKISARAADVVKGRAKKKPAQILTEEDVWLEIFDHIRKSTYLCGRAPPGRGYTRPFKLTIDYVLRPSEFGKILEGGYDDDERFNTSRSFDANSGRSYGSAEQATRESLASLYASSERGAGRGNPRSDHG
jgi:hypothetical protein